MCHYRIAPLWTNTKSSTDTPRWLSLFFFHFRLFLIVECLKSTNPECVYTSNRKLLLYCLLKEKGSKIHLYFAFNSSTFSVTNLLTQSEIISIITDEKKISCEHSPWAHRDLSLSSLWVYGDQNAEPWPSRKLTVTKVLTTNSPWHDDVIKWKHFPCYWPVTRSFGVFF